MDNTQVGKTVYVYVDESGSITKTNISNNRYFVIAMLFTEDPVAVRRLYKKRISQLMRKNGFLDFSEGHDIALNLPEN